MTINIKVKSRWCPKVMLKAENSMLGMKHRLWKEKLMYMMQLKRLDEKSLALEIYQEQKKHGWPGLHSPKIPYFEGIGSLAAATPVLKVV